MRKIAFVFSGQGAQYTGMGEDIYEINEPAKEIFDCVDIALKRKISEICFSGTEEEQGKTINTQPCIFAVDLAVAKALEEKGIIPQGVAGFSLGEYAALAYGKAISVEEAAKLVQKRAELMQVAVPEGKGAMAAIIGIEPQKVMEICQSIQDGYVAVSNYNSPQQVVIAGDTDAVTIAIDKVAEIGGRGVKLAVSVPSHCALMKEAGDKLKSVLDNMNLKAPVLPVYFNFSGESEDNIEIIKSMMINQIQYPVRWIETIQNMYDDGFDIFIECGPGKTLMGLVKKILKGKEFEVYHVDNMESLNKAVSALKHEN